MKMNMKKYPILISTIVSCAIIVISLFILGFFGLKLGVSLGGGEQIEVVMKNDASKSDYISKIDLVLGKYGYSIDTYSIESKYVAGEKSGEFTKKVLVIQVPNQFSDEDVTEIKEKIATTLEVKEDNVTVENIVSSVVSKSTLKMGIAFAVIALCFFIFGLFRYDVFASISFVVAYLHNIILYFAFVIITRVQFSIDALSVVMLLTLVMSAVLISVYENFRKVSRQKDSEKTPLQELMIESEKSTVVPFIAICGAVLIFVIFLLFVPALRIKMLLLNILISLIVTCYTTLLIGPSTYVATLEIREMNRKAVLSRNDTVNKAIKKKVKKNTINQNKNTTNQK